MSGHRWTDAERKRRAENYLLRRRRRFGLCLACGGRDFVDAIDNLGNPYKGCARCIIVLPAAKTIGAAVVMRYQGVVLTAASGIDPGWRQCAAQTDRVPVYHTGLGRVVGTAGAFHIVPSDEGEKLWGDFEVEDGMPVPRNCAGILAVVDGKPRLVAVMLSNLSHGALASLTMGFGKPLRGV